MKHDFTEPDLAELDRIWPIGQMLAVSDKGAIIVAGAYEGRYIAYLHEMFPMAEIHGFEPQEHAFLVASKRAPARVTLYCSGLATKERRMQMGHSNTDSASVLVHAGHLQDVSMIDAVEAIQSIPPIDLFVMNMEGYEWALIPYLLDEMMHHRIKSLAIQFHADYVSLQRAQRVRDYLGEYYTLAFADTNNWTLWERKS